MRVQSYSGRSSERAISRAWRVDCWPRRRGDSRGDWELRHVSISERSDKSNDAARVRRLEIFTGAGRRRSWTVEQKAAIVAESFEDGAPVRRVVGSRWPSGGGLRSDRRRGDEHGAVARCRRREQSGRRATAFDRVGHRRIERLGAAEFGLTAAKGIVHLLRCSIASKPMRAHPAWLESCLRFKPRSMPSCRHKSRRSIGSAVRGLDRVDAKRSFDRRES